MKTTPSNDKMPVPGRNAALPEGVSSAQILVVDDMPLMRKMIGMCLHRGGFANVSYAEDGDDALKQIAQSVPDLVILDINMPRLSGYDVCRKLRADPATASMPILVQSASETAEERVEVFAVGATDFVSKPINHPELLARVCMHLENRFLIHNLSGFQERMQSELNMAREMQHSLLPETEAVDAVQVSARASIEAFYKASSELGGDLWGTWPLADNKIGIYVLDVTGHGVGAALNTFSLHATMARFEEKKHDPAAFLTSLNRSLVGAFQLGRFATMFYGVLDCETHELTYAGAGAPRPIIFGGSKTRTLDSSGLPIAIVKSATYENLTDRLEPGESLFCYSDVLIEAEQADGPILGEEGLIGWIETSCHTGDRSTVIARLLDQFFRSQDEQLADDLTAVAIHRHLGGGSDDQSDAESVQAVPSVFVVSPDDSSYDADYSDLKVPGLAVQRPGAITASDEPDGERKSSIAVMLIDGTTGPDFVRDKIAFIDQSFVNANGPVVVTLDGEPDKDDPILSFDRVRYFDASSGIDKLRRFLAEEADDYIRIAALRQALAQDEPDLEPLVDGVYRFASRREAQKLATVFSHASPDPMPLAIGLSELFFNAIEHGCLEIGHNEKGQLIEDGKLSDEVTRRRNSVEFRHRYASVEVRRSDTEIVFRVKDPGKGFDFAAYLADEAGHEKKHGRGITMANGCFSRLTYYGCGNDVEAVFSL